MKELMHLGFVLFLLGSCSNDNGSDPEQGPAPFASFIASATTVDAGSSVTFDNTSLNATSFLWLFPGGDPNMSTEENPTVTYNDVGNFTVTLTAANDGGQDNTLTLVQHITVEEPPMPTMATYNVTFVGNWSASNHPADFPSGDHFSPAIGMVHKTGTLFFEEDEIASDGMEIMAETGATAELALEIDALVTAGMASSTVIGEGLTTGFSEATFQITVTNDFPLVTLVSMIAPSPDWFVAIENVSMLDNGAFVDDLTVDAISYDAGTDGGPTFTSADDDSDPADNISKIT
ncbi:MAG TPA: spondin domain-containing protein, partial [Eudoraea sp.]|nr:spondin domain-containing protein [Eudoraea sp.]